ncbi:unnamed protein product [Symbiodinium sp. CCMP2456]|nr:unnamed protein product [Symbiodinium sp. CCMP2456]
MSQNLRGRLCKLAVLCSIWHANNQCASRPFAQVFSTGVCPVSAAESPGRWCSGGPLTVRRAQADPNFAANVGQAIDTVRSDHARLPGIAPGASVADPGISLEIAQVSGLRFVGSMQYGQFWDNFRQGTELISTSARSEVTNVVHSGLYLRVRWRLVMIPRDVLGKEQARSAVQAARGALQNFQNAPWGKTDLFQAGTNFLGQAEEWASSQETANEPSERIVDLNSVYELDPWNGRIVKHTLEFRSPEEDFGLLGALQGVPSVR